MAEEEEESGPYNDAYRQQRLKPICSPILTSTNIIFCLVPTFAFFVIIGSILLVTSSGITEQTIRYDNLSDCAVTYDMDESELPKICKFDVTVDEDMELPIYVYYELTEFYQNHRYFLSSYSWDQLAEGKTTSTNSDTTPGCDTLETYNSKTLYPCGLVANAFFRIVLHYGSMVIIYVQSVIRLILAA
eukprot:UN30924